MKPGKQGKQMVAIEKLFLNALHDLAVGYEMVQLMHAATIGFFLMMLSMLIVENSFFPSANLH